jgi:hypothetical protein
LRHTRIQLLAVLAGALASVAPAAADPGLRLSWDHCAADGLVANKAFACDTNTGTELLFGSFELPVDVPGVQGLEFSMDIAPTSDVLPAWWELGGVGACRGTSLSLLAVPPVPSGTCVDLMGDGATGGLGSFTTGLDGPNIVRFTAGVFVPAPGFDAAAGTDYFGFVLAIHNQKTVGSGACGGCNIPVCVGLAEIRAHTAVTANDLELVGGPGSGVTWQGAHLLEYVVVRRPARANSTIVCSTTGVPTRAETWGRLKALFR